MSTHKRKIILSNVTVKLGCSSSCRRPKLSSIFHPKPRRHNSAAFHYQRTTKHHHNPAYNYSSSSSSNATTTTTFSPAYYSSDTERDVQGFGRIGGKSVAVEKDSDDPYVDFRQSMLQMILEKEIYSKDELRELLNCFLQLNSPYYHGVIVRAFTEIWHSVFSLKPGVVGAELPVLHGSGGGGWCSRDF
ncbi:PREDICTED: transcription repressor OFP6-like [Nicotiana attenuata]|nr:PREDICTED: transcription repressor OFP6-like [Nicotiana attenuata]